MYRSEIPHSLDLEIQRYPPSCICMTAISYEDVRVDEMDLTDMPVRTRGEQTFTFYSNNVFVFRFPTRDGESLSSLSLRNVSRGGANKVFPHPRKRIPHLKFLHDDQSQIRIGWETRDTSGNTILRKTNKQNKV
jgi:hypothetical protein